MTNLIDNSEDEESVKFSIAIEVSATPSGETAYNYRIEGEAASSDIVGALEIVKSSIIKKVLDK